MSLRNHLVFIKSGLLNSVKNPIRLAELIDPPVPLIILVERQVLSRRNKNDINLCWAEDKVSFFSWSVSSPSIVADVSNFSLKKCNKFFKSYFSYQIFFVFKKPLDFWIVHFIWIVVDKRQRRRKELLWRFFHAPVSSCFDEMLGNV